MTIQAKVLHQVQDPQSHNSYLGKAETNNLSNIFAESLLSRKLEFYES